MAGPNPNRTYPPAPRDVTTPVQHSLCFHLGSFLIIGIALLGLLLTFYIVVVEPFFHCPAHCYVENACLTQFNLTGKNLLRYDLYLDVNITNPSKKYQADYQHLDATANFDGEMIGLVSLPPFCLGHKKTVMIHPVFGGRSPIGLDDQSVNEFKKQRSDGFFRIDVEIRADKIDGLGKFWGGGSSQRIRCPLLVPLVPSNSSASGDGGFTRTKCEVKEKLHQQLWAYRNLDFPEFQFNLYTNGTSETKA